MNTSTIVIVLIGLLLPVVSARVVKAHWDSSITGLVTGGLAAADGVAGEAITAATQHTGFDLKHAALAALLAWAAGTQITQRGVLANTNLEARLLNAGSNAADDEDPEDPTLGLDDNLEVEIDDDEVVDGFEPTSPEPDEHQPEHASA